MTARTIRYRAENELASFSAFAIFRMGLPDKAKMDEHTFDCSQSVHKVSKKSGFPRKKIPDVLAISDYKTYNKTTVGEGGAKYHKILLNDTEGEQL